MAEFCTDFETLDPYLVTVAQQPHAKLFPPPDLKNSVGCRSRPFSFDLLTKEFSQR